MVENSVPVERDIIEKTPPKTKTVIQTDKSSSVAEIGSDDMAPLESAKDSTDSDSSCVSKITLESVSSDELDNEMSDENDKNDKIEISVCDITIKEAVNTEEICPDPVIDNSSTQIITEKNEVAPLVDVLESPKEGVKEPTVIAEEYIYI